MICARKIPEYPSKRFCFLTAEEAVEGNYFKVKQILAYDELQDFLEYAMNAKMTKKCRTAVSYFVIKILYRLKFM